MVKDHIERRKVLKTISAASAIPLIGSVTAQDDSIADDSGPNIGYLKKNPTDPITQSEVKEIRQRVTKQGGSLSGVSTTSTDSPNKILLSKIRSSSERIITGYALSLQQGHPIEKIVTAPEGIRNKTKLNKTGSTSGIKSDGLNSSIDEFVQRQKQISAQNQSQLSTAQADDSPASPRGSTTKIGTIHSELPAYDLEAATSPTKVGRIELWLDAWEVDGAERTYLTALRGKQIPASYSQQDGESSAKNDYTWLRQYWNKTDLGSVAVKDRAPKGDKSGGIDTTLNIGISSDKTGNAGLSVDMEVPKISREEKSDIGNTIEQGYQYAEKTINDDSTDDPVTFYSLGHGVVSKEPDSYGLCTAPPGYPDQDGPTLLEAEMKAKFEYQNPIPDVGGTGSNRLETTGSITIDGKLACLDEPVQP